MTGIGKLREPAADHEARSRMRGDGAMKTALSLAVAILFLASPASAEVRRFSSPGSRNPVIVRTPPSSAYGAAGISAPTTKSNRSMYPTPIKKYYDPLMPDPTITNPNLRKQ
jgi:hypothetical protein